MTAATPFEILPAIDLRGGRVVRLREGDFAQETAYGEDPLQAATRFVVGGARWLHVVDLDAARTGQPQHGRVIAGIVAELGERIRVETAGGLRDEAAVAAALEAGAERVVIGTAALAAPGFAGRMVRAHGVDRVAVAIDVRGGQAVGHGWAREASGVDTRAAVERLADEGVRTFEVTAIERDGRLDGPDHALYEGLVALGRGAIIASGGIATLDDLRGLRARGCSGAILGRALYEGRLDLEAVIAWADEGEADRGA
jgi:phosphoribosylformimino-5-aminoimidazole carboxamide ribotide isomerase